MTVELHRRAPGHELRFDVEKAENSIRFFSSAQEHANVLNIDQTVTRSYCEAATEKRGGHPECVRCAEPILLDNKPGGHIE